MRSFSLVLFVALAVLLAPALLTADEIRKPSKEMGVFKKQARSMSADEKKAYALDYIAKWEASGKKTSAISRYALAQFQQYAEQYDKALEGFRSTRLSTYEKMKDSTRDYAAVAEAALLLFPAVQAKLGQAGLDKAGAVLTKHAEQMLSDPSRAKSRGKLLGVLARLDGEAGRYDAAHAKRMQIIKEDPKQIASQLKPVMRNLLASAHTLDGYAAAAKKAAAAATIMGGHASAAAEQAKSKKDMMIARLKSSQPDSLDENDELKKTDRADMDKAERSVYGAVSAHANTLKLMDLIKGSTKPFSLLGKPAPEWTLEHAFGDVSELGALKGKVVILDFWSTWVDDCNFPVMRDFHKQFAEKGLVVVGVTATASVCYEKRFDFDEDMKAKARPGRKFYAARLATDRDPENEGQAILGEAKYREREKTALVEFVKNHELPWQHVMIEKTEPFTKYAAEGWPSLVVIDKQGRLRYVRSGPLARGSKGSVDAVKKIVEALLAE